MSFKEKIEDLKIAMVFIKMLWGALMIGAGMTFLVMVLLVLAKEEEQKEKETDNQE